MKFLIAYISRGLIVRLILATFCLALLDMLGIAVIFPYLTVLTSDLHAMGGGYVAKAYALTGSASRMEFITIVSAALAGFFVLKFVTAYLINRMKFRTNAKVTTGLSNDLFALLLRADYGFLSNSSVSEMAGIINAETIHATLCLDSWVTIATEITFLLLIFATIAAIDVKLAVFLVVVVFILTATLYLGVVKRATKLGTTQSAIHLRQYRFLFGIVNAIKDIKILGLEGASEAEHRCLNANYAKAITSFNVYQTLPRSVIELLAMLGLLGASVVVVLTQANVTTAVPVIGFLAVAALRVIPSYSRIIAAYGSYNYYKSSLGVIERLHAKLKRAQIVPRSEIRPFNAMLEIRDLCFSHGDKPVLAGVTLTIHRGKSVGIVGLSGSGKTTFLDVLAGLRQANSGQFLLDGKPVDPFGSDTLRRLLGYVPQNVTLIDETIAFNISFEIQPDPDRLQQAARVARIEKFINSLPQGFDTLVGENGVRVSGGQKQRIGIARALYRDPQVLIFDEATSSLDNITERELNEEIAALSRAKTLIVVAHRLTTVTACDEIHVFDQGRIVGSGTHASLLKSCPAYRMLHEAQDHPGDRLDAQAEMGGT